MESENVFGWLAADLAPGDRKSAGLDRRRLCLRTIRDTGHPMFREAYLALWETFGPGGGMETEAVIARRFTWTPEQRQDGWTLFYQLLAVRDQDGPGLAAVRDHSVIIPPNGPGGTPPFAVVHLSHLLIEPRWRRTGLAGWMRAFPLQAARECLRNRTISIDTVPITLIAEMDPLLPGKPENAGRMLAYGQGGFQVADPAALPYAQPDFRPPAAIDADGRPAPVPMTILLRRVGREGETTADGAEIRALVAALYQMYAQGCRPADIEPLRARVAARFPAARMPVRLFSPRALIGG